MTNSYTLTKKIYCSLMKIKKIKLIYRTDKRGVILKIYLVGGAVRDQLLGLECKDKDYVVVGSNVQQMLDLGYQQVGKEFPVFLHPHTHCEYALARTEHKTGHGYTQFICDFNPNISLQEDLKRRDLTINALAQDEDGNIIDYYHGLDDLKHKILRHVSDAFVEDPLRVLRVARFAAKLFHLGFKIAPETKELMRTISLGEELLHLTPARVWIELHKALETANPEVFIAVLHEVGALAKILPEIDALFGVPGPAKWHPEIDTGIHTLMTLERIAQESNCAIARFAMLCHDLGKALTPKEHWPHHHKHNELGVIPLDALCQRLPVPKDFYVAAKMVVLYHNEMHHLYEHGALGIVNLFERLDSFRKPLNIKIFALCCKCDFLGRKGFEARAFPRYDYILAMHSLCMQVKAQEFIEAGFKGLQIKDKIKAKRVELVNLFLQQLPASEITNTHNEMPPIHLAS